MIFGDGNAIFVKSTTGAAVLPVGNPDAHRAGKGTPRQQAGGKKYGKDGEDGLCHD